MVKEDEDVNFETLTAKPAELKRVPRGKPAKPNPLAKDVERTWKEDRALSYEVPASEALSVEAKLRKAGLHLRCGVAIQFHLLPEDQYRSKTAIETLRETDPDHLVRVAFKARDLEKAAQGEDDDQDE